MSCKKEEQVQKQVIVTYEVESPRALVVFNDEFDNEKKLVVSGIYTYQFEAVKTDTASLTTYTPSTVGPLHVKATIYVNGNVAAQFNGLQQGHPQTLKVDLTKFRN